MAGCNSCSTTSGTSSGCQNNGTCGTSDCNKMNSFDWLSQMGIPVVDKFDIVEVKFKGGRKEYYRNVENISLTTGDPIVVDVPNGHHLGYVSLQGELVRLQMQKRKVKDDDNILKIYRVANAKDLEKWEEARNREVPTLYRTKQIIHELNIDMKLSDVEFQADNTKATFYYSADDRVDFRELIKLLASEFKVRIEMRQISLRQEAGRLGGIGVCGRELCCSTWIHEFKSVSTAAARYQNLSLNPSKLSGQCGRLKCCLNYELDTYMSALKDIPSVERPLKTDVGIAKLQKTDIFRKLMWFSYNDDNNWHSITCDRVREIIEMNEKGKFPFDLKNNTSEQMDQVSNKSTLELEALDKKFNKNKKKKKKKVEPKPLAEATTKPIAPIPSGKPTIAPISTNENTNKPKPKRNKNRKPNRGQESNAMNPTNTSNTPKPQAPIQAKPQVSAANNPPKESPQAPKRSFPPRSKDSNFIKKNDSNEQ